MSQSAVDHVQSLRPDQVTHVQKHLLLQIAMAYNDRHGSANMDMGELATLVFRTPGHLARMFKQLDHLLQYSPGRGKGNFSQFKFLHLETVEKALENALPEASKVGINPAKSLHKVGISATAIRKENLNLDLDQKKQEPPAPFASQKGSGLNSSEPEKPKTKQPNHREIEARAERVRMLNARMIQIERCCDLPEEDHYRPEHSYGWKPHNYRRPREDQFQLFKEACASLGLPWEILLADFEAAGIPISEAVSTRTRKEPQKAMTA